MLKISYGFMLTFITVLWILIRFLNCKKSEFSWKRELELLLVYVCIVVVARFTFFPFSKVGGKIQPLIFDAARVFPVRLNLVPIKYLFDYEIRREALINFIGNTAMFIPLGIVWPCVFRELNTPAKTIGAGIAASLTIEILQLPFFDRVTDIDDLILNSLGFILGYGIWRLSGIIIKAVKKCGA